MGYSKHERGAINVFYSPKKLPYYTPSHNTYLSTATNFFCTEGGRCGEVRLWTEDTIVLSLLQVEPNLTSRSLCGSVVLQAPYNLYSVKLNYTKFFYSNFRSVARFLRKKTFLYSLQNVSSWITTRGKLGAKHTHLCGLILIGQNILLRSEKRRPLLWLARTPLRMKSVTDMGFQWLSISKHAHVSYKNGALKPSISFKVTNHIKTRNGTMLNLTTNMAVNKLTTYRKAGRVMRDVILISVT